MRDADPQITFADLEFLQQGIRLEPLLQKISDFRDDHDDLVELVRLDLERGLKKPETGGQGLTPDQVLRSLILMGFKNWDYRELRERINDGYTLRKFTAFYCQHDCTSGQGWAIDCSALTSTFASICVVSLEEPSR